VFCRSRDAEIILARRLRRLKERRFTNRRFFGVGGLESAPALLEEFRDRFGDEALFVSR
jgi:hypothetical protein